MSERHYFGIDYGLSGSVGHIIVFDDIDGGFDPLSWDLYDSDGDLALWGIGRHAVVCIEAFGGQHTSRASAIRYGRLLERLRNVLGGREAIQVPAATWKRELGLIGVRKTTYEQRKRRSVRLAKKLFPKMVFARHDHAEALLIAEYARRKCA